MKTECSRLFSFGGTCGGVLLSCWKPAAGEKATGEDARAWDWRRETHVEKASDAAFRRRAKLTQRAGEPAQEASEGEAPAATAPVAEHS